MAQVHTLATLSLPRSLVWVDEFQWSAPQRAQARPLAAAPAQQEQTGTSKAQEEATPPESI